MMKACEDDLKVTAFKAKCEVFFYGKVGEDFHARHVNVCHGKDGVLEDLVTERDFKKGEEIYCSRWRPEGMTVLTNDGFEMFVFWENMEKCLFNTPPMMHY